MRRTTCCGVHLPQGGRHCAYCRRTILLIRERRCVTCTAPVVDTPDRAEGRCHDCLRRQVRLSPATRRLLVLASKARYRERLAA